MASLAHRTHIDELNAFLRTGRWEEARAFYEGQIAEVERAAPEFHLAYAIALIRTGDERAGRKLLSPEVMALPRWVLDWTAR